MNKKIYIIIFISLMLTLSYIGIRIIDTIQHENVHVGINKHAGHCSDIKVNYRFFGLGGGSTYCTIKTNMTEPKSARISHNLNEVIGYNIETIYSSILLCTLIICITIILSGEKCLD